ncbi:RNA-binding protein 43-like, partial [Acipenser oxyrinchus oxyrinchus]
ISSKVKMDQTPEARTIVVSGVPQHELDCRRMADKLVIHFQKAKSAGGDVEKIKYPTRIKGVAYITFEEKEGKYNSYHMLELLTALLGLLLDLLGCVLYVVVFCYAHAEVDLSLFSEHEKLVKELRTRNRAVRILPLQANQRVQVEGPFTAIKKLREDLMQLLETSQREKSVTARDRRRQQQSSRAVTPEQGAAPFSRAVTPEQDASNTEACLIWLDTNVFRYIQHVLKDDFEWILKKHDVQATTQVEGELTRVTLKKSYQGLWQLETAKLEIEQWVSNVQSHLRTETIHYQKDLEEEKFLQACKDVSCGFPRVLFTPVEGHIDIIGNSSDCYLFCQLVAMQMKSSLHDNDRWLSTSPCATDMSYYSTGRTGEPDSLPMTMNSDMHRMPGNNLYSSMRCDNWSER